ncbi:MAG: hypothetical protein LBS21_09420 [Clostridiales bacterium]|jgi:hypothetical protein|nr:hypothetical protein [Clostridiales bacterium]
MTDKTDVKREFKYYMVYNEGLLYRIADSRLLHKVHHVSVSRSDNSTKLFFFDKDPEIKEIIDDYWA